MGSLVPDSDLPAASNLVPEDDLPVEPAKTARAVNPADANQARLLSSVLPAPSGSPLAWVFSKLTGGAYDKYAPANPADAALNLPNKEVSPGVQIPDLRALASPEAMGSILPTVAMASFGAKPAATTLPARPSGGVAGALADAAEAAAVRSTNADRTASRRAFRGSDDARHALGRFMLDSEIPLRSPKFIRDAAQQIQAGAGSAMGNLVRAADASGARVDLAGAVAAAQADPAVARLASNTVSRKAHGDIMSMLEDQLAQHGEQVPPSVAHDIRMQLDQLSTWDQAAPKPVQKAWRAARAAIDQRLDDAMQQSGLAGDWNEAQAAFAKSRKLSSPNKRGLADIGVERREGNKFLSPSEVAGGLVGGIAAATHNPVAGAAIPLVTIAANRYAMPVAARTLDPLSKMLAEMRSPPTEQAPFISALADAMRRRVGVGLPPAAADQGPDSAGAR